MKEKSEKLENIRQDIDRIQLLITRNRQSEEKKFMDFPFLIIEPSSLPTSRLDISMQSNLKKLSINSNNSLTIVSDIQTLKYVDFGANESTSLDNSLIHS